MSETVAAKLATLREDFARVAGQPFKSFFCPILFTDEDTQLCKAHIVNQAFESSSRRWTVQRKDVDNFFGSMFEGGFVSLQLDEPGIAVKAILDPALYRRLAPKVLLDGAEVKHFVADGPIPKNFAELRLEHTHGNVRLGLKADSQRLADVKTSSHWEFEVDRDFRIPAFISLLKAAHLTLFELIGYGYALRSEGMWLGHSLGAFYVDNVGRAKTDVLQRAATHFGPLVAMVRPVTTAPPAFTGTIDDGWVHLCWNNSADRTPWGMITYIRTAEDLHAVLVPVLEHEASFDRFTKFLESDGDELEVSAARFDGTSWNVAIASQKLDWPPANLTQ